MKAKWNQGYSLLELAIVILIVGLFAGLGSYIYTLYKRQAAIQLTQSNLNLIAAAIGTYQASHGGYPCPASLTQHRGDNSSPGYGHVTDCSDTSTAIGFSSSGVYIAGGMRSAPSLGYVPRVRIGAVPFRELQLAEDASYDGYNQRIVYAVTEPLAVPGSPMGDGGAIDVQDGAGVSAISPPKSIQFLLISTGPDQAGGFNALGTHKTDCPAAALETLNCQYGAQAVFRAGVRSTSGGASQFDDFINYFASSAPSQWLANGNSIYYKNMHGAVGVNDDAGTGKMKVAGTARARENLLTGVLCDITGSGICTAAANIGGVKDGTPGGSGQSGMTCPTGQYMTGIADNAAQCATARIECPGTEAMTGINADGTPKCVNRPCNAQTRTICTPNDVGLPAAADGTIQTFTLGTSRSVTYECTVGNWSVTSSSGACTCHDSTWNSKSSCGFGYSGQKIIHHHITCPAGTDSPTEDDSACVCVGGTQKHDFACPAGDTGKITKQQDFICPSTLSPWTEIANTCTCNVGAVKTRNLPCPSNYTGTGTDQASYRTCSPDGWTPWTTTADHCTCTPGIKRLIYPHCPAGQAGLWEQQQTFDCANGTWGNTETTFNSCADIAPPVCQWHPASPPQPSSSHAAAPQAGVSCATCGATGRCWSGSVGAYLNFPICNCSD